MAFGVQPNDLRPGGRAYAGRHFQPVMYNPSTGDHKFTLVYYTHKVGDIPVFRSDLRLLIRNNENHDLVWASTDLRDLDDWTLPVGAAALDASEIAESFVDPGFLDPDYVKDARTVIWAGADAAVEAPRLAVGVVAGGGGFCGGGLAFFR